MGTAYVKHNCLSERGGQSCEANEDQIKNVKAILFCFESVSGLKINFFKSELIGIRVEETHGMICRNPWMQSAIFPGDLFGPSFMQRTS